MYVNILHVPADLHRNEMYVSECGYDDNGRLMTWLPYRNNSDSSALVHDISQETLLGDQVNKYYLYWYSGPQVCFYTVNCEIFPKQIQDSIATFPHQ